jgi:F0F1-type ATP synthase membrane subunit c/vacuolar-type H+-ATPase subunit K
VLDNLAYFLEAESAAYAEEVLWFAFWSGIAKGLAALAFASLLGWIAWRRSEDQDHHSAMVLTGVALLVAAVYFGHAIKAHVAPRVVVMETLLGADR